MTTRYTVEREDESGHWTGMADTDDLQRATELAHDADRRIRDNQSGQIVPTTVKPFYRDSAFWKTGAAFAVIVIVILAMRGQDAEASRQVAVEKVRRAHPELAWAFAEWDRCAHGEGDYAKQGYVLIEQCDLAVNALATKRGEQLAVRNALREQHVSETGAN